MLHQEGSLLALAILFSLSFMLNGLSEIFFSIANRDQLNNWGWSLAFSIITFIAGILLFVNPELSVTTLAFFIGFVILFRSIAAIGFAIDVKNYGSRKWGWLIVSGILGAVFAFILIWNPYFAGISVVYFIGFNFLFAGFFSIGLSVQLKKLHTSHKELSTDVMKRFEELAEDIHKEWSE
ncbi:MAG: DUF308 domain-containing protein [Salinivirgaceae bacterium]|nr:DUF308 domain-containing protein [Salinivirgaceae bacterium]